jgi:hypothetical protein
VCKASEDCKQDIKLAMSENDKIEATLKYHQHVLQARKERDLYVELVEKSKSMFVNREHHGQAAGDNFLQIMYIIRLNSVRMLSCHTMHKKGTHIFHSAGKSLGRTFNLIMLTIFFSCILCKLFTFL